MKQIFILIIFLCGCGGKSVVSEQVIFFTDTENQDLQADIDHFLAQVMDYLDQHQIEHIETSARFISIDNQLEYTISDDKSFAMIMIRPGKESKTIEELGTEVDLLQAIQAYFEIKKAAP